MQCGNSSIVWVIAAQLLVVFGCRGSSMDEGQQSTALSPRLRRMAIFATGSPVDEPVDTHFQATPFASSTIEHEEQQPGLSVSLADEEVLGGMEAIGHQRGRFCFSDSDCEFGEKCNPGISTVGLSPFSGRPAAAPSSVLAGPLDLRTCGPPLQGNVYRPPSTDMKQLNSLYIPYSGAAAPSGSGGSYYQGTKSGANQAEILWNLPAVVVPGNPSILCNNPTLTVPYGTVGRFSVAGTSNPLFTAVIPSHDSMFIQVKDLNTKQTLSGNFEFLCDKTGSYQVKFAVEVSDGHQSLQKALNICKAQFDCIAAPAAQAAPNSVVKPISLPQTLSFVGTDANGISIPAHATTITPTTTASVTASTTTSTTPSTTTSTSQSTVTSTAPPSTTTTMPTTTTVATTSTTTSTTTTTFATGRAVDERSSLDGRPSGNSAAALNDTSRVHKPQVVYLDPWDPRVQSPFAPKVECLPYHAVLKLGRNRNITVTKEILSISDDSNVGDTYVAVKMTDASDRPQGIPVSDSFSFHCDVPGEHAVYFAGAAFNTRTGMFDNTVCKASFECVENHVPEIQCNQPEIVGRVGSRLSVDISSSQNELFTATDADGDALMVGLQDANSRALLWDVSHTCSVATTVTREILLSAFDGDSAGNGLCEVTFVCI